MPWTHLLTQRVGKVILNLKELKVPKEIKVM
jgi:hypothetical protein